ncbi:MAG: aminoglycoside 6'-N-acetyltransferase [Sphingomonadaceae bacterium]
MIIRPCAPRDAEILAELRHELWPCADGAELLAETHEMLATSGGRLAVIALDLEGEALGFAEATIRHDYVNGCDSSPVGFLEGIYVRAPHRRKNIARAFVVQIEQWVRAQGCTEFASDALIDDAASHAMHDALGFIETGRVVYFRKLIG